MPGRYLLLAGLLLACFVPRAWMAWRCDILWSDSIFYLHVTEALEQSDYQTAFRSLGLNTFPVVLLWLRKTGLDWTITGQWWSVLMASLAVLPLFGWIRRQFDDQVAFFACLLYAIQPKLVGYAPLIIRDPTYWLLLNLFLYLAWRAVVELRCWLFLASGVALTLAVYTRIEGCLLLIPLLLWASWRWRTTGAARVRLALGTAACLAMTPLLVIAVNTTVLKDHSKWELGRVGPLQAVWSWMVSGVDAVLVRSASAGPTATAQAEATPRPPTGTADIAPGTARSAQAAKSSASGAPSKLRIMRKVLLRLVKAMTYGYAVLIAVGLYHWRRVFFRSDQQALLLHNAVLVGCTWFYYVRHGGIDIRYFFSIIMISLPYTALGLLQIAEWIAAPRKHPSTAVPRRRAVAIAGALAVITVASLPEATLTSTPVMRQQAELGAWIFRQQGPGEKVLGPNSCLKLLAYHAEAQPIPFPKNFDGDDRRLDKILAHYRPGVIFLWEDIYNPVLYAAQESIIAHCTQRGYQRVPPDELPASCRNVQVLVDGTPPQETASQTKPKADSRRL